MSQYQPHAIRRQLRRQAVTPEGVVLLASKSMTRDDESVRHNVEINLQSGTCKCGCEHFKFRLGPQARRAGRRITVTTEASQCKHIKQAIAQCVRRGEIKFLPDGTACNAEGVIIAYST